MCKSLVVITSKVGGKGIKGGASGFGSAAPDACSSIRRPDLLSSRLIGGHCKGFTEESMQETIEGFH